MLFPIYTHDGVRLGDVEILGVAQRKAVRGKAVKFSLIRKTDTYEQTNWIDAHPKKLLCFDWEYIVLRLDPLEWEPLSLKLAFDLPQGRAPEVERALNSAMRELCSTRKSDAGEPR